MNIRMTAIRVLATGALLGAGATHTALADDEYYEYYDYYDGGYDEVYDEHDWFYDWYDYDDGYYDGYYDYYDGYYDYDADLFDWEEDGLFE